MKGFLTAVLLIGLHTTAPAQSQSTQPAKTAIVYVTHAGKWYHRADCLYLAKKNRALTLEEAKAQGLRPCKICRPK